MLNQSLMKITTDFTEQEIELIETMVPGKSAEEICVIVLRDWLKSNTDRRYLPTVPQAQVVDELIQISKGEKPIDAVPQEEPVSSDTKI